MQTIDREDLELLTEHQQRLAKAKLQTKLTRVSNAEAKARLEAFRTRLRKSAAGRAAPAAKLESKAAPDDAVSSQSRMPLLANAKQHRLPDACSRSLRARQPLQASKTPFLQQRMLIVYLHAAACTP